MYWSYIFSEETHVYLFSFRFIYLGFSICSSFGRQLCHNCGWAGSEPYVRLHITDPPCCCYTPAHNFEQSVPLLCVFYFNWHLAYARRADTIATKIYTNHFKNPKKSNQNGWMSIYSHFQEPEKTPLNLKSTLNGVHWRQSGCGKNPRKKIPLHFGWEINPHGNKPPLSF